MKMILQSIWLRSKQPHTRSTFPKVFMMLNGSPLEIGYHMVDRRRPLFKENKQKNLMEQVQTSGKSKVVFGIFI